MEQNIYDNPEFFSGYYELRSRSDNYNELLEQPAMANLLPDLHGKSVLDLGCGFGRNCADFVHRGARRVVGIDISEKMLNAATVSYTHLRLDTEKELEELQELLKKSNKPAKAEKEEKSGDAESAQKPQIEIDDFLKSELTVCKVIDCEKIEKADKLLKFTLFDGSGERTVVSGIAKYYSPDELKGHNVIVVTNLKPAKLRGVESNGMILSADTPDGGIKVVFADDIPAGGKLR